MKNKILTLILSLTLLYTNASELVLIQTRSEEDTKSLFLNNSLTVHYCNNDFVIATNQGELPYGSIILDKNPWFENISYYIVYTDGEINRQSYINTIEDRAKIIYNGINFLIISTNEQIHGQLPPFKNDGMVRIFNNPARIPQAQKTFPKLETEPIPFISNLLAEVNGENITSTVQHLQNYGTRDAYTSFSVDAQRWIGLKFEDFHLDVETMDFQMPSGPASDNIIAIQEGIKYPEEYVVVGAHFDSRCAAGNAPGADDNASGTAAVIEIARVLSEYEFDRSIIYCAFSGEEYGLYGSYAFAQRCYQESMNILGYINLDMIGYLKSGNAMMTSLIYPNQARELAEFYTDVCSVYLPNFIVQYGMLTGGDSDHTSFNNSGYMGIFPFENISAYSPYIHTVNDIVGLSYNNENQAVVFAKAALATVALMSQDEFTGVSTQTYQFGIYPNPTTDYINIELFNNENAGIEIFNQVGQLMYSAVISGNQQVSTYTWPKGIYFVKVKSTTGSGAKRIIIQ